MMIESKPQTCKRCGCNDVAWHKSKKGNWYLVEGGYCHPDLKGTGRLLYSVFRFHNGKVDHVLRRCVYGYWILS